MRKTGFFMLVGSIMLFSGLILSVWFVNLTVPALNVVSTETSNIISTPSVFSDLKNERFPIDDLLVSSTEKDVKIPFNGFIRNLGQWTDASIHYCAMERDLTLLFGVSSITYASTSPNADVVQVSVSFPGSNLIIPEGQNKAGHSINYFYGDTQITNVPAYMEIWYTDLYSGIDLRYYMSDQGLKYDFVVHPEADPNQIAIQVSQSMRVTIEDQIVSLRSRTQREIVYFQDAQLQAWQADGTPVVAQFVSKTMNSNTYGFQVGTFDFSQPLIIDPLILSFSTYLGGSSGDYGRSIDVSITGDVYITGSTDSSNFPTLNGYNNTYSGNGDAFITKMDATGTLVFSTFLGGTGEDKGRGIAVDTRGNSYIIGTTGSTDFPTKNAFNDTHSGSYDAFVTKLNATGNGLVFSTYLGGIGPDEGFDIAVDAYNNSYVTGFTFSADFPTQNAYNSTLGGGLDAFVAKFNTTGWLNFSTYLGGDGGDIGRGIAVDLAGNSYITGNTTSANFPTKNAYNDTLGFFSGFVTKLNSTGNGLVFSTYLGGDDYDECMDIDVDTSGHSYITGFTQSFNFPTKNAYNDTYSGSGDGFVTKLNTTGNGLVFSTYLGAPSFDWAFSIAVDAYNNSYITGLTYSNTFPIKDANQSVLNGSSDAFVTKLNATGTELVFSTFLGGSNQEEGYGISVDADGDVYITGGTSSNDFPTQNPYDNTYNGLSDSFVTRLHYFGEPLIILTSPLNNSIQKSGIIVDLNITDPDGISLVLYNWDESANVTLGAPYDLTLPAGEGVHELHIYANDSLDSRAYKKFLFTTDDTPPTIILKTPVNDSIHPSGTVLSLNITDAHGISQVKYNWDGTSNNTIFTPYDIVLISGDGQHILHVYAYDNAGTGSTSYPSNWVSKLFMFTTDDNAPIINLWSPINGSTHPENTLIDLNVVDTVALSHVFYNWDGNANTTLTAPYDLVLPTSEGQHTLYVYANDTIGHWATAMFVFTTSAPIIITVTIPIMTTVTIPTTVVTTVATDFFTVEVFLVALGALTVVLWRRERSKRK
ncbi:MAG: SBBP repeat-containing protein [Promethearchaeota archaeon]